MKKSDEGAFQRIRRMLKAREFEGPMPQKKDPKNSRMLNIPKNR